MKFGNERKADKHIDTDQRPGAGLGELHRRAEEAAGVSQRRADEPERGDPECTGCRGGLQEQVRLQAGQRAQGTDSRGNCSAEFNV